MPERTWWQRLYLWATERLYAEFAWAYDAVSWLVSLGHWNGWRRAVLPHIQGERVLELAFGTGELLMALSERDGFVCGLELSPAMHRITARKLRRRGLTVPRIRARAQGLPFPANSFDTIVATFPASYGIDPATLAEVQRVLRPGGRWVIGGLCFEADSRRLGGLLALVFGGGGAAALAHYCTWVEAAGFTVEVDRGTRAAVYVPVLILREKRL